MKDWSFYGKFLLSFFETEPKFALLVQLKQPASSWRWPKSNKTITPPKKASTIGLSNFVKIKALSPLPFPGKIWLLFALFGLFLAAKGRGHNWKVPNQHLTYPISPKQFFKKLLFSTFQFCGYRSFQKNKGHFRKFLTGFSSSAAFLDIMPTYLKKIS